MVIEIQIKPNKACLKLQNNNNKEQVLELKSNLASQVSQT